MVNENAPPIESVDPFASVEMWLNVTLSMDTFGYKTKWASIPSFPVIAIPIYPRRDIIYSKVVSLTATFGLTSSK